MTHNKSKDTFTIIFWNAGGLTNSKTVQFEQIVNKYEADVFAILDTGKKFTEKFSKYGEIDNFFSEYQVKVKSDDRSISTGIIVGALREYPCSFEIVKRGDRHDKLEAVSLNVWKNGTEFPCVALYNPPENIAGYAVLPIGENSLIFGDFNCRSQEMGYEQTNESGQNTMKFIEDNSLQRIVSETSNDFTFLNSKGTKTNPDLVLAGINLAKFVSQRSVGIFGTNEHKCIIIEVKILILEKQMQNHNMISTNSNETEEKISKFLSDNSENFKNRKSHVKFIWNYTLSNLLKARDKKLNNLIAGWSRKKDSLLKESQANLNKEIEIELKNKIKHDIEGILNRLDSKGINLIDANNIIKIDGLIYSTNLKKAEAFVDYYENEFKYESVHKEENVGELIYEEFSIENVEKAVSCINKCSRPGIDGISLETIENFVNQSPNVILALFNSYLKNGIPEKWRKTIIDPVLKSDKLNASKIESYRLVPVKCLFLQIYENMLMKQLFSKISENLSDPQAIHLPDSSPDSYQAITLCQMIQDAFYNKLTTLVIYVDFKSLYHSLSTEIFFEKLRKLKTPPFIIKALFDVLHKRLIGVRCYDRISSFKVMGKGLLEDSTTSKTILSLMINDIGQTLSDAELDGFNYILGADDLVLLVSGKEQEDIELSMNSALEILSQWAEDNMLTINPENIKYQLFSKAKTKMKFAFNMGRFIISETTEQAYQEIVFDSQLTFEKHAKTQADEVEKRLSFVKYLEKNDVSQESLISVYERYILPTLTLGQEIFICSTKAVRKILEDKQKKAICAITGDYLYTSIEILEEKIGTCCIQKSREDSASKIFSKALKMHKNIFVNYKRDSSRAKKSFAHHVLELCTESDENQSE